MPAGLRGVPAQGALALPHGPPTAAGNPVSPTRFLPKVATQARPPGRAQFRGKTSPDSGPLLPGKGLQPGPAFPRRPGRPRPREVPAPRFPPKRRRRALEPRGRDAAGGSDVFPRLDAALGCRAGEGASGFSQGTFKLFL